MFSGIVTSVIKAVYVHNSLVGVIGNDMVLSELLYDRKELESPDAYAFLIKRIGNVMYHPLIPEGETVSSDFVAADITMLELGEDVYREVLRYMQIAENGDKTVNVSMVPWKGSYKYGIRLVNETLTYHFRNVSISNFSFYVVLFNSLHKRIAHSRNCT